jgi:thiol-disulfide isomerase/thioredoxin
MTSGFQFGLMAITFAVLFAVLSVALARTGERTRWLLVPMALTGIVVARLAFVLREWDTYRLAPLSILYLDVKGWIPAAGIAAACVYAFYWGVWRPEHRKIVMGAVLTAVAVWLAGTAAATYEAPKQSVLPNFTLQTLDGRSVDLSQLKGHPVVINVWATWCPPCRKEMPLLHEAQGKYRDVVFVFINAGETPDLVSQYLRGENLLLRNVLLDVHLKTKDVIGGRGLPTTIFYGADGSVVSTQVGELARDDLEKRLSQLKTKTGRSLWTLDALTVDRRSTIANL